MNRYTQCNDTFFISVKTTRNSDKAQRTRLLESRDPYRDPYRDLYIMFIETLIETFIKNTEFEHLYFKSVFRA